MISWSVRGILAAVSLLGLATATATAASTPRAAPTITLGSTTSTEQSGLFAHLLPLFQAATGIEVKVVAVGTGQALGMARRGDADAILVHDRAGEDALVAEGAAIDRRDVMVNDFLLIGPKSDPARTAGAKSVTAALQAIAQAKSAFTSRGDDSGTHRLELRLWQAAGVDLEVSGGGSTGDWYRELGAGMGQALNTAAALEAYVIADRATWAAFKNRQNLVISLEGDRALFNPYASLLVNPAGRPHIKTEPARIWHEWLTSEPGRAAIASFRIDGQPVFFPASNSTN